MAARPKYFNCFLRGSLKENPSQKLSSFSVPNNKLEEWRTTINNRQLKSTSRLCDAQFREEEIIKGEVIGGTFFPSKLWRLQKDGIHNLFLGKLFNAMLAIVGY